MGHHPHHHGSEEGISHRVNNPRFLSLMTRRAHSFKCTTQTNANDTAATNNCNSTTNAHHEIGLLINSPRSENRTAQLAIHVLDLGVILDLKQAVYRRYNLRERVSLLKRHVDYVVEDLELKEKKNLGHWMFFFYGVCLFLGVFKICATGWFGSAIKRAESGQVG